MESQLFLHCTCPICYFPYDLKERIPRLITCNQGHTICSTCLSIQASLSNPIQCPFDKQIIILLDNNIARFPINRALLDIIEEGHANCSVHIDKKLDLICRQCKEQICDRCERKGTHQGHPVSVIEDALDEAKQKIGGIKQLLQNIQKEMDSSQEKINEKQENWLKIIDNQFSKCMALLLKKREDIHYKIKEYCQGIKESVHFESFTQDDSQFTKFGYWKDFIEKQKANAFTGTVVPQSLYELLEEDMETLEKSADASISKEKEKLQKIIQEMEQIKINLSDNLEDGTKPICEIIGLPETDESSRVGAQLDFRWRADWEKMDIFDSFNKMEESYFTSILDQVLDTYRFRVEAVQHLSQDNSPNSPKIPPFYLCSFSCFLGSDSKCGKLLKWYILDSTLQNSEKKFNINELKLHKNLFKILEDKLAVLPDGLKFDGLWLTKEEKSLLCAKIKEYTNKSILISHVNFMLDSYMKEHWIDACYAVNKIFKLEEKPDLYIDKVLKDGTRVNCLKLALIIERHVQAEEFQQALELVSYLQGLVNSILKNDELHCAQLELILNEAIGDITEEKTSPEVSQLKEKVCQFRVAEDSHQVLSKAILCYSPSKKDYSQVESICDAEIFHWREKGENSAYRMKQLTNQILNSSEPYVDFVNALNTFKNVMTREERKRLGYVHKGDPELFSLESCLN